MASNGEQKAYRLKRVDKKRVTQQASLSLLTMSWGQIAIMVLSKGELIGNTISIPPDKTIHTVMRSKWLQVCEHKF